jgi:hypothetical protein
MMTLTDIHTEALLPAQAFRDFGECFLEYDVQSKFNHNYFLIWTDLLHNGKYEDCSWEVHIHLSPFWSSLVHWQNLVG